MLGFVAPNALGRRQVDQARSTHCPSARSQPLHPMHSGNIRSRDNDRAICARYSDGSDCPGTSDRARRSSWPTGSAGGARTTTACPGSEVPGQSLPSNTGRRSHDRCPGTRILPECMGCRGLGAGTSAVGGGGLIDLPTGRAAFGLRSRAWALAGAAVAGAARACPRCPATRVPACSSSSRALGALSPARALPSRADDGWRCSISRGRRVRALSRARRGVARRWHGCPGSRHRARAQILQSRGALGRGDSCSGRWGRSRGGSCCVTRPSWLLVAVLLPAWLAAEWIDATGFGRLEHNAWVVTDGLLPARAQLPDRSRAGP